MSAFSVREFSAILICALSHRLLRIPKADSNQYTDLRNCQVK